MHKYDDYAALIAYYKTLSFPKMKIVVTGTGRVATGAVVLNHMGIKCVSPQEFLEIHLTKQYILNLIVTLCKR